MSTVDKRFEFSSLKNKKSVNSFLKSQMKWKFLRKANCEIALFNLSLLARSSTHITKLLFSKCFYHCARLEFLISAMKVYCDWERLSTLAKKKKRRAFLFITTVREIRQVLLTKLCHDATYFHANFFQNLLLKFNQSTFIVADSSHKYSSAVI